MSRPGRLLELTQLLGGRRSRRVEELAERFGVSPRTVFRDLADLERHRIPIARDEYGYRLLEYATLRPLNLTAEERAILKVALANPVLRRQAALRRHLELLEAKLDAVSKAIEETPEALRLAGLDRSGSGAEAALEPLREAARRRVQVEILYTSLSGGTRRWRGLDPYEVFQRDAWYVAGRCHRNREVRIFRLDRIAGVREVGKPFQPIEHFDLQEYLRDAWTVYRGKKAITVVLRFLPAVAPLVEHGLHHPGEEVSKLVDGGIEYRVRLSHLDEIARWIVGFGGACQVVEPEALRERVADLADGSTVANRLRERPDGFDVVGAGRDLSGTDSDA